MNKKAILIDILRDKDRKSLQQILYELTHTYFIERNIPYHYFIELLYKKQNRNYTNYVSHQKLKKVYTKINSKKSFNNLLNKILFEEILKSKNIPTTNIIGYNKKSMLFYEDKKVNIQNTTDLEVLIQKMIEISANKGIFVKQSDSHGGKHTFKFTEKTINNNNIKELFDILLTRKFIFQDLIKQHSSVSKIYRHSINTIRVNTFYNQHTKKLHILSSLMRFGTDCRIADNGGLFVPINTYNWCLQMQGQSFLKHGGNLYERHPDSLYPFNEFIIPYGKTIPDLLELAAPLFDAPLVGWDIAITQDGPLIIEANHNLHLGMAQMASGGFKDKKEYMQLFDYQNKKH